ncbi:MAG: hypothetical protein NNA18_11355, partial [Nitrospira sp.]|nr:hypothetical protein [Nitrospira sp.]
MKRWFPTPGGIGVGKRAQQRKGMEKEREGMAMPRTETTAEIEEHLRAVTDAADPSFLHRLYWEQNEFVRLERFIPQPVIERCTREVDLLEGDIHRNYVPGHKQGGSVSYYVIREKAAAIVALYRSEALRSFLNRLIGGEPIEWCPENDPHSC